MVFNEDFHDKMLVCGDCGKSFTWTGGEQKFFKGKGFDNPPKRCPSCRTARKQGRENIAGGTKFRRDNY